MNKYRYVTKFVVRNLSLSMTMEKLDHILVELCNVQSVRLATDLMTGRCAGRGRGGSPSADR